MTPRRLGAALLLAVCAVLIYLVAWPVPVSPAAWHAPENAGLRDPHAPNDRLKVARAIDLAGHAGPEDIAGGPDGFLYAGTTDGNIVRFRRDGRNLTVFAKTGGRPLGLEFDQDGSLYVANAYLGLQRVSPQGDVRAVVSEFADRPIVYANDVAVARNGKVYFSESSSKFGAEVFGGTWQASFLDILEHGGHGRIFEYDSNTASVRIVMSGLNFANGVAISDDQRYLLVSETGHYRIWKHWLTGAQAGSSDLLLENLPGFPDNINNGMNDRFWIGLVAPRHGFLDDHSTRPWLRKLVQRLPAVIRPKAARSSHVISINGDGQVLMDLQDTAANFPSLTGVCETRESLFLTTLFGDRVARLDKKDLR